MFELFFGGVWTAISVFMAIIMYSGNGDIEVNGVPVSHAEFEQMLWPKLFIGLFILIGVAFLIAGFRKLLINAKTSLRGFETYGVIVEIAPTNTYVNDRPVMAAHVATAKEDGTVDVYKDPIGVDAYQYQIGDILRVKHCDNDINIIEQAHEMEVPSHVMDRLRNCGYVANAMQQNNLNQQNSYNIDCDIGTGDTIVINGVEYTRKQ